jgi:hypothetical protein
VLALVFAACTDSRLGETGVVVRDSAGVRIVESSPDLEFRPLGWRVAEEPDLAIGMAAGDDEYQLFAVEGAAVLPDGRIAVVNAGTQEIRFFDDEGRYIETVGGSGAGPGEFQMPQLVHPVSAAGELLIWDLMLNRFTLLGPDGELIRTIRPEGVVRSTAGWDGSGVVLSFRSSAAAGLDTPDGLMPRVVTFEGVPLEVGDPIPIGEVAGRTYLAQIRGQPAFRRIPFDPEPASTVGSGAFHLTTGSNAEVRTYDSSGDLTRMVRVLRAPEPLPRSEFTSVVEEQLEAMEDEDLRREWRGHFDRMPVPEVVPVYRGLLVDGGGYLWAEHFRVRPGDVARWSVFDPDGAVLGTIETPQGLVVYQIGEDFLLGRMRDDFGVERVVRFPLDRRPD